MDLNRLNQVRQELEVNRLSVMCTGEINVDWRELRDLQLLRDGSSLKASDDDKITRLAESLLRFGIVNNLQVWFDSDNKPYCFDAHHRKKALALLDQAGVEIPMLPATRCLARSMTEAKKLLLVKESKSSWVDYKVLPAYMNEINFDFNIASAVIDFPEFEWMTLEPEEEKEKRREKENKTQSFDEGEIRIETGMLVELGRHRLLCGDATSSDDLERLIGDMKIDMVFSDPPYGIDVVRNNKIGGGGLTRFGKIGGGSLKVESRVYKKIEGDQSIEAAKDFYERCLKMKIENMIFWGGNYFTGFLPASKCWIIWDKENNGDFSDCEMAWTSFKSGGVRLFNHLWDGMRRKGPHEEELKNRIHPTQKPVGLFCEIFERLGDFRTVLDGFLGSGSTLIACEKTGKKCFAMEIDPYYCQVSIQRWIDYRETDIVSINGETLLWSEFMAS